MAVTKRGENEAIREYKARQATLSAHFNAQITQRPAQSLELAQLRRMSAIGPKRTSLVAPHMSAFGTKADIPISPRNVYF